VNRLVRVLLLVPLGIGLAALAALVVGIAGAVSAGWGRGFAEFLAATGLGLVVAGLNGADPSTLGGFVVFLWLFGLALLIVPIALVALALEAFAVSSWIAYAFGMAVTFLLVPLLFPGDPATHGWPEGAKLGFAAAGLTAGSVYWLVAGRSAGSAARIDDSGRLERAPQPREGEPQP